MTKDERISESLGRRAVLRGGGAALLAGAALAAAATTAQAAPTPPGVSGTPVAQNDPRLNTVINVRSWGALGNGTQDDTAAIQAALNAATNGETVFFPEGTYKVSATLTHAGPLGLVGVGQGRTWIEWSGSGNAIQLSLSTPNVDYLLVSSFTINTTRADAGTAISAVWTTPGAGGWPHAVVEDLEITRSGTGVWQRGLLLGEAWKSTVRTVTIWTGSGQGVGVELAGQCVDCNLIDLHFSGCETPILLDWWTEGTVIYNAVCIGTVYGIKHRINPANGRKGPWVTIRDCHINSLASAVELTGTGDTWISDNLFYRSPESTQNYTAIKLTTCRNMRIEGNEIYNLSTAATQNFGINVAGSSQMHIEGNKIIDQVNGGGIKLTNTQDSHVTSNFIRNVNSGISIDAASNGQVVAHNTFRITNATGVGPATAITNAGGTSLVVDNLDRRT